ncbi:Galactoside O-acetyltransferase [compost metagenome]
MPPAKRRLYSKGPVIIEDNVWLGEGVVVLPGVTIGENSIVGANAVVTKSIPKNCVAGGNPARIIREIS